MPCGIWAAKACQASTSVFWRYMNRTVQTRKTNTKRAATVIIRLGPACFTGTLAFCRVVKAGMRSCSLESAMSFCYASEL